MIKAAFFDVDGTLLSHATHGVPESTRAALRRLRERGVTVNLATGRHAQELALIPPLGIDFDAKLLQGGQICVSGDDEPIFDVPLKDELAQALVRVFERDEFALQLVEYDRCYINHVDERVRGVFADISSPAPPTGSYDGAPLYMGVAIVDAEEEARMAEELPACHITRWHDGAIDVVDVGFDKGVGVAMFCEMMGIAQEETIAFGDSENDREMLEWCGIGVAMGNSDEGTKAVADYVAPDIDDDGIARALADLGLI